MRSIKPMYQMIRFVFLLVSLSVSSTTFAQTAYSRIVVFGASLSDSGNAFVMLSDPAAFGFEDSCNMGTPANVPPYENLDDFLIPDGAYAKGGHHLSNGAIWIEQFARGKGLSGTVRPALRNISQQASNYAVGGARASAFPCRFNLSDQLDLYLNDFSETSADTLIVFEIGGNDVRDALAGLPTQDPGPVISAALGNIGEAVQILYEQGARNFVLMNVPAIGKTPAVRKIDDFFPGTADVANQLTEAFNLGLAQLQAGLNSVLPGIEVRIVDVYTLLADILDNPVLFGFTNTEDACVTPNVPPFKCKKPDGYVFWDGIHPTKVVHSMMAQKAAEILMVPLP